MPDGYDGVGNQAITNIPRGVFGRAVPTFSAITMTLVGAVVTFQALTQFGLVNL